MSTNSTVTRRTILQGGLAALFLGKAARALARFPRGVRGNVSRHPAQFYRAAGAAPAPEEERP